MSVQGKEYLQSIASVSERSLEEDQFKYISLIANVSASVNAIWFTLIGIQISRAIADDGMMLLYRQRLY